MDVALTTITDAARQGVLVQNIVTLWVNSPVLESIEHPERVLAEIYVWYFDRLNRVVTAATIAEQLNRDNEAYNALVGMGELGLAPEAAGAARGAYERFVADDYTEAVFTRMIKSFPVSYRGDLDTLVVDARLDAETCPYIVKVADDEEQTVLKAVNTSVVGDDAASIDLSAPEGVYFVVTQDRLSFEVSITTDTLTLEHDTDDRVESLLDAVKRILPGLNVLDSTGKAISITAEVFARHVSVDTGVFAFFASLDPVFRRFMYIDESKRPITDKPALTAYYKYAVPDTFKKSESATVTLTNVEGGLRIKMRNMRHVAQGHALHYVLGHVLWRYLTAAGAILQNVINPFIPGYVHRQVARGAPAGRAVQGKRIRGLAAHDPNLFSGDYSTKCQKSSQPYVVSDLAAYRDRLVADGVSEPDHRYLEFVTARGPAVFACYPREEDEADDHVWPGLQFDEKRGVTFPCCFKQDQYAKDNSLLNKRLRGEGADGAQRRSRYIVRGDKPVAYTRFGDLPYNIAHMLPDANADQKLLRYGAADAEWDSAVKCLLYAHPALGLDVSGVRDRIASSDEAAILCKQELYDQTVDGIKRMAETSSNLDPRLFVGALSWVFECNLYLFSGGDGGDFAPPRFAGGVYYPPRHRSDRPTVVLVLNEQTWEVVVDTSGGQPRALLTDEDAFVQACVAVTQMRFETYSL